VDGRPRGHADGSSYAASKAVVSTIHIAHLGRVGEENLTPEYRAGIARWKPSVTMFVAHYALSEAPRFRTATGSMEA